MTTTQNEQPMRLLDSGSMGTPENRAVHAEPDQIAMVMLASRIGDALGLATGTGERKQIAAAITAHVRHAHALAKIPPAGARNRGKDKPRRRYFWRMSNAARFAEKVGGKLQAPGPRGQLFRVTYTERRAS